MNVMMLGILYLSFPKVRQEGGFLLKKFVMRGLSA